MRVRYFFEADNDGTDNGNSGPANQTMDATDPAASDGTDNGNSGNNADQGNDQTDANQNTNSQQNNQDDQQTDQNQEDGTDNGGDDDDDNPSDDDFNIDADDDTGDGDDGGDTGTADTSTDDNEPTAEEDAANDESSEKDIKAKEKEIFASLSPAEQRVKNKQLKNRFKDLYDNCSNIIEKINEIGGDIQSVSPQLKRTISILFEIKSNIYDYLMDLYDANGYFENEIIYNKYLVMLNSVKNILVEIDKAYDPDKDTHDVIENNDDNK